MGQGESRPVSASSPGPGAGLAFHVLRVADNSPAAEAGLDPFFDFLVGVNGRALGEDVDALTTVLDSSENVPLVLQVWSTKRQEMRDVPVIPSRSWSLPSSSPNPPSQSPSLLGLSLRLCDPRRALENVWHVLEILEGSPAESAGLVPFGDWILGYAGGVLRNEGDFYEVVESHIDQPLRLFVYNIDFDVTREVVIVPNRLWSPDHASLLGCGVGYGLLHRIPPPQRQSQGQGEPSPQGASESQPRDSEGFDPSHPLMQGNEAGPSGFGMGAQGVGGPYTHHANTNIQPNSSHFGGGGHGSMDSIGSMGMGMGAPGPLQDDEEDAMDGSYVDENGVFHDAGEEEADESALYEATDGVEVVPNTANSTGSSGGGGFGNRMGMGIGMGYAEGGGFYAPTQPLQFHRQAQVQQQGQYQPQGYGYGGPGGNSRYGNIGGGGGGNGKGHVPPPIMTQHQAPAGRRGQVQIIAEGGD